MRFLADENFPGDAVQDLRAKGFEVTWIRTDAPGIPDEQVLRLAVEQGRVLLTFDKDFGELAHRSRLPASCGVILFRLPMQSPAEGVRRIVQAVASRSDWPGRFSVVTEQGIRTRPFPADTAS